jgi:hypothetical protein
MATLHEILPAAAVTDIDVGDAFTDHGIIITWMASRGILRRAGRFSILSKGIVDAPDFNPDSFGDDVGLTLTADLAAGALRLNCDVDNASLDDITMNYNLAIIAL